MRTVAIIQARMGSTRLPGKTLADLAGKPVLDWVVRAARAALGVDDVWVATSTAAADDRVAERCHANGVAVFRGSETDVLDRYAGAVRASGAEIVVRITADCPLLDPAVIAETVRLRSMCGAAYASNVDPPTWPDGLDCEVVTAEALLAAAAEATRPSDREHVTTFVRNNRDRFTAETLIAPLPGPRRRTLDSWTRQKIFCFCRRWPQGFRWIGRPLISMSWTCSMTNHRCASFTKTQIATWDSSRALLVKKSILTDDTIARNA